jgi:hypothetical protein
MLVGTLPDMRSPQHAEAFFVQPGGCFRLINLPDGHGQRDHCPEPAG